jgi:hypothetical protein
MQGLKNVIRIRQFLSYFYAEEASLNHQKEEIESNLVKVHGSDI